MTASIPLRKLRVLTPLLAALVGVGLAGLGCQMPGHEGGKVVASVVVSGCTETRIRLALLEVFEADHYRGRTLTGPELVFEKEGTTASNLLRGGWLSSRTVTRAKLQVTPVGTRAYRLECRAFTVQYPGDSVMEEEYPLRSGGSLQKLLDEVMRRIATE